MKNRRKLQRRHSIALPLLAIAVGLVAAAVVEANDEIIETYTSVRDEGMGNTRFATGLYEDNFFSNPARVTANPTWRVSLLNPTVEMSSNLPSNIKTLSGGGNNFFSNLASTAGQDNHARVELIPVAVYFSVGKWSYAIGLITSTQADIDLRQSYSIDPLFITDIGPAVTVGRKFLAQDELSLGMTTHATYRVSTNQDYSFTSLIQGQSLSPSSTGGQGAMLDFDLGSTYDFHWHPWGMKTEAVAAIDNLLGGRYANLGFHPISQLTSLPTPQPRTYNAGVAFTKPSVGWLTNTTAAFEVQDVGNNPNGSMYRLLHLGAETHLGLLALRTGVNQGYLTAGLGLDLKVVNLDVATYGEELGLNAGDLEERVYAFHLGFNI